MVTTLPVLQRAREIDEDGAGVALILERRVVPEDLVDVQLSGQVELDAGAVLEHAEADGVLAGDGFGVGIDADVEVVIEQVVVGAERPVGAAQKVEARGQGRGGIDGAHVPRRGRGRLGYGGAGLRLLRGRKGNGAKQAGETETRKQHSKSHAAMLTQRHSPIPWPLGWKATMMENEQGPGGQERSGRFLQGATRSWMSGSSSTRPRNSERTLLPAPSAVKAREYKVTWVVRRKRAQLPRNADERDRARFAKAQSYMVRRDDKLGCQNIRCRKPFEITSLQSLAFIQD